MEVTPAGLVPANQNPWYVLMTVYGEQEDWKNADGLREGRVRHEKNRSIWNAWAAQNLATSDIEELASQIRQPADALRAWARNEGGLQDTIRLLHKEEMERRNPPGFAYPGFPDAKATYLFQKLHFPYQLRIEGFVFANLADFIGSTFGAEVLAQNARFLGPSSFPQCSFVKTAGFQGATFTGNCSFLRCDFQKLAGFYTAKFKADVEFNEVEFCAEVDFEAAVFSGFSHFQEAVFHAADGKLAQKLSFDECNFEKPANFLRARFVSKYPSLVGALLHERTLFGAQSENWPLKPAQNLSSAKTTCGTIRHILGKQGQAEDEHFFFRREMGFASQIGGSWARLPYHAFGYFSDYGFSIERPLLSLVCLWFIPTLVFTAFWITGVPLVDALHLAHGSALSFANIFPVFGFHRLWLDVGMLAQLPWWMKALAGLQTVLGVPLLFLIGLGLRTRFRLR